jgi:phage terminase large subunit-like protein
LKVRKRRERLKKRVKGRINRKRLKKRVKGRINRKRGEESKNVASTSEKAASPLLRVSSVQLPLYAEQSKNSISL